MLPLVLIILLMLPTCKLAGQEKQESARQKSIFVEFLGSGLSIATGNFDIRFNKGNPEGLGMRVGIGGGAISEDPLIGEGSTKTKMFSIPLEVNYILGKKNFALEAGCSLTYVSITEDSTFKLFGDYTTSHESENVIVSYVPIGFRLKPKVNGFMLKFNLGPLFNFSGPNLIADEKVTIWGGLAAGYSFY